MSESRCPYCGSDRKDKLGSECFISHGPMDMDDNTHPWHSIAQDEPAKSNQVVEYGRTPSKSRIRSLGGPNRPCHNWRPLEQPFREGTRPDPKDETRVELMPEQAQGETQPPPKCPLCGGGRHVSFTDCPKHIIVLPTSPPTSPSVEGGAEAFHNKVWRSGGLLTDYITAAAACVMADAFTADLQRQLSEARKALNSHLCPEDAADWLACTGEHCEGHCVACANDSLKQRVEELKRVLRGIIRNWQT